MRQLQRAIIAMVAFALVGLVPFAGSTATADDAGFTQGEVVTSGADASGRDDARAKPRRWISLKFKATHNGNRFKLHGWIKDCTRCQVKLMRSNRKWGTYRQFRVKRANKSGGYAFKQLNRAGWYRTKVPGNAKYATSWSVNKNRIHVIRR